MDSISKNGFPLPGPENPDHRVYIIAEIGTSHGGDLEKAKHMIQACADAGADCAKFQVVFAKEILHRNTGYLDLPGGKTALYDRFLTLEKGQDFFQALKEEADRVKIDFLASPFGIESARLLRDIGSKVLKVASPELNHIPLLREIRTYGLPVILSSGVSTLGDIEEALGHLEGLDVALLHCITAYPAPEDQYNLRLLPLYREIFGIPVGTSDHSLDPLAVPLVTALVGGSLVEKHFCLSRQDPGLDDPIALDPKDFSAMVKRIRELENTPHAQRHRYVEQILGQSKIEGILGSGKKTLAPAERANYGRTNRSIHVMEDLKKGHKITGADVGVLRTEKVLTPGIHPRFLDLITGAILTRDISAGEGLNWEDLITYQDSSKA